jgi:2-aminoethylphosphonate-pyruvate transaminase
MADEYVPDNPYLLLTPGPLSTSKGVRGAMLRDWCTWDADYNEGVVQDIRRRLVSLASADTGAYTAVLMQGSGSFSVEACLGSAVPRNGKLLIISNGAYGKRMARMSKAIGLDYKEYALPETEAPDADELAVVLDKNPDVTHVAFVHCETTTGMLNPLSEIARVVKSRGLILIADAMSSFGGIPFDAGELGIDFLISSSNKCVQGAPGFSFIIAKRDEMSECEGNARSLCLDMYEQWREMDDSGKWRFTSPTHVVHAFFRALKELEEEGGVAARCARYTENQRVLSEGMRGLGFRALLPARLQSPIITSFLYPDARFDFGAFYTKMKEKGFVLYPGKLSDAKTFRVGSIGAVFPEDMRRMLSAVSEVFPEKAMS